MPITIKFHATECVALRDEEYPPEIDVTIMVVTFVNLWAARCFLAAFFSGH